MVKVFYFGGLCRDLVPVLQPVRFLQQRKEAALMEKLYGKTLYFSRKGVFKVNIKKIENL